jgi:hypothetical protein
MKTFGLFGIPAGQRGATLVTYDFSRSGLLDYWESLLILKHGTPIPIAEEKVRELNEYNVSSYDVYTYELRELTEVELNEIINPFQW